MPVPSRMSENFEFGRGEVPSFVPMNRYEPIASVRDEAADVTGAIRQPWLPIFESCGRHGALVLKIWRRETARISRERGLAYRLESMDDADDHTWDLDPIPWVISPQDWSEIENGIIQRTHLYQNVLRDVYGPRESLKNGPLPPELILGNEGYLRSLSDTLEGDSTIPGLGMCCFDLARTNEGKWVVLSNRFDSPFGLGLALENRTVVNQVLPNLFKRCQVRRIGYFFEKWFEYLAKTGRELSDRPRVVILDSNIEEGNSEVSFLANYCGINRAAASDLMVRDGSVWLKTLYGLEPIHVIWNSDPGRRIDPLSVPRSLYGGVPGLFEALRKKNVAILGHPGTEVIESSGLLAFEDQLAQKFLGQSLMIPSVRSEWGGNPDSLNWILNDLSNLVIKEVGHHWGFETVYGASLSPEELESIKTKVIKNPERFVGQENLEISTIPLSRGRELKPRRAVMRVFSFVDGDGNVQVMPGGLGRVGRLGGEIVSTRTGGASKDVWVRSDSEDGTVRVAAAFQEARIVSELTITSRSAENLFWSGRYAERTQTISRIVSRLLAKESLLETYRPDLVDSNEKFLVEGLFEITSKGWLEKNGNGRDLVDILLFDEMCPAGIPANMNSFHRAAMATREEWSPLGHFVLQQTHEDWFNINFNISQMEKLEANLAAFVGLSLDSMTRDSGWALLDIGRSIERIVWLTGFMKKLLKSELKAPGETLLSESVLLVQDSLGTYRTEFLSIPKTEKAFQLLIDQDDYPRSLLYLIKRIETALQKLPEAKAREAALEIVSNVQRKLPLFGGLEGGEFKSMAFEALDEINKSIKSLSDYITQSYFSHANTMIK